MKLFAQGWRLMLPALLACLMGGPSVWAQRPAFRQFTGREGLPQSQVRALLEDSHGFLWVGTHGGVARLGASGFQTFGQEQGLSAGRVRALLEDSEGAIWVAQADASLGVIRGGSVQTFGPVEGLEAPDCYALALNAQQQVLVGTRTGLFRQVEGRFQRVPLPAPWGQAPVYAVLRGQAGLWVGGRGGQVAREAEGAWVQEPLPGSTEDVLELRLSPQGEPWARTAKGLFRHGVGRWSPVSLPKCPSNARLESFCFDGQRGLLVGLGDDGLWLRDGTGLVSRWTSRDGLPQEQINLAYRDSGGVLWIGTNGEGLLAQVFPGLSQISGQGELFLGAVLHLQELNPQTFLLGSGRGLFRWEAGRGLTRRWTRAEGLPSNETWCMLPAGPSASWVGTSKGLVRLRGSTLEPRVYLPGRTINHLLAWKGHLLAATDAGVWELNAQGKVLAHAELPPEVGLGSVFVLADIRGEVLVGSSLGLFRYREGRLERIYPEAPFANLRILCLMDGPQGSLWVGSVRGLFRESASGWQSLERRDGIANLHIYFLGDAGGGRVLVGHGKGVTLLDPKGRPLGLNEHFGLLSDETNRSAFLRDSRGRLWWGMTTGVNVLNLSEALRPPPLPAPALLEAGWRGGRAFLPKALDLPAGTEGLHIAFDLGQPISLAPPLVEAYLEGHESGWQALGTTYGVNYGTLPAGRYVFHVRGSMDGVSWVEARPLPIRVRPAWHEGGWVRALGLILLAGLLGLVLLLRTRHLKDRAQALEEVVFQRTQALAQRNQELESVQAQLRRVLEGRERLMRGIAHDLRSPLSGMLLLADYLEEEVGEVERKRVLGLFRREGGRMDAMAERLLDEARAQANLLAPKLTRLSPHQVFEGMEDLLGLQARQRGLGFHFAEDAGVVGAQVMADPLALQQVLLNLVGNAMKFTPTGGEVFVRSGLLAGEKAWILEVRDTGRGLEEDQITRLSQPFEQARGSDAAGGWGLGLSIVTLAAEAHGGRLAVASQPGQGATFSFILPLAVPAEPSHPGL